MKMLFTVSASALALLTAAPVAAQDAVPSAVETIDLEPSDARIALARQAVDIVWPQGQAEFMVDYMVGPYADYLLTTPLSQMAKDFRTEEVVAAYAEMIPEMMAMMGEDADMGEDMSPEQMSAMVNMMVAMVGDQTIQQMLFKEDEHFDERLSIARSVLAEEIPPIARAFEGPMRDAMAQVFAKKFTDGELNEIAAFASSATGQKFARTYITMGFEPEYYSGIMQAIPAVVPRFMPLVEKMETRMAHLPPMFPGPVYCEDLAEGEEDADCIDTSEEAIEESDEAPIVRIAPTTEPDGDEEMAEEVE